MWVRGLEPLDDVEVWWDFRLSDEVLSLVESAELGAEVAVSGVMPLDAPPQSIGERRDILTDTPYEPPPETRAERYARLGRNVDQCLQEAGGLPAWCEGRAYEPKS